MNIKRSFSLIEVIITIVIISMISTIVSISINKSLKYYRFKTNIKKIESYFEFAKKMFVAVVYGFVTNFLGIPGDLITRLHDFCFSR